MTEAWVIRLHQLLMRAFGRPLLFHVLLHMSLSSSVAEKSSGDNVWSSLNVHPGIFTLDDFIRILK